MTELRLTEVQVQERLTAPGAFFEMETVRVRGVDLRAWKGSPPTLRAVLEASRGHADKPFLVLGEERYSFAEHYRAVAALAQRLVGEYGVGKGDRLAIAMRNLPQWSVAFWAAVSVGAIAVPLNSWWTAEELEFALRDSGSRLVFTDSRLEERLSGVLPELGIPSVVTRIRADGAKDGDGGSPRLRDGAVYIDGLLAPANGPEPELPPVELGPEDDATILYTSGTTGRPKGALGTHRNSAGNILTTVYAGMAPQVAAGSTAEELLAATGEQSRVTLLSVPFFHATGLHSVLVCSIALGGELVLMHKWDPEEALRLIQRERVTGFGGVPTIAWQVLNHPRFAEYDTSSLTGVSYGGAPASPALVELIGDRLPERTPGIGYGLTETSAGCAYNNDEEYRRRPDSVGRPSPVADARIVGPDGEADLPVGEVGELLIRGPQVVTGYWNRPEATEVAFTDGWLHTGDLARLDDEGYIYIVDRAKDMVIRGGENVYCTEVESALVEHPAVFEVAVIGVPHRELGEEVGAVVHLRPGRTATPEELGEFLGKHLAAFKVPAHWWVREEELPHNPNGKLMKNQLRKELLPEG